MAEKILNTRIQLKYDTLANWNSSTFKLKAGELAIVTLGENVDGSRWPEDEALEKIQHPVLFKVGDGNHTFSQLPFASALAADVYAWAKASDVKLEGKTIKFVGTNKTIDIPYITEAEAITKINEALTAYSTTEQMNAAIKVETDRAEAAEKALGERIDAFNLPESGFASKSEFDTLKGKVEDEDGALARANAAYQLAETKTTMADVEGKGYATKTYTDDELAKKADVDKTYTKTEVDGLVGVKANSDDVYKKTEVDGLIAPLATTEALTGVGEKAQQGIDNAAAAQKTIDDYKKTNDERIEVILNGTDAEKVDSLNELIAWVDSHGGEVNQIKADIEKKLDASVYNEHLTTQAAKDKAQDDKITALEGKAGLDKVGTVTSITAGDGLDGGEITESGTIALNAATKASLALADSAIQQSDIDALELNTMSKENKANYYTKTEADAEFTNATEVNGQIDAKITALDLANTYQAKGNYATFEQGVKADSALQEITTTANNGLKVTGKNQIDIDDTVVFVFDCGSATKNIAE